MHSNDNAPTRTKMYEILDEDQNKKILYFSYFGTSLMSEIHKECAKYRSNQEE